MRRRLGEALLERGLVTQTQLIAALELQQRRGWRLGHALLALGYLSEDALLEVLGAELHVDVVDVREVTPPADVLRAVRARLALEHGLLPLELRAELDGPRLLKVAMADPGDLRIIDELSFTAGAIIEPVLARASDIARAVVRVYRLDPDSPAQAGPSAPVYARDEIPSLAPTEDSGDLLNEMAGGPLETELAASEDLNPIPLTQRKSVPLDPLDVLPAIVMGRPSSSAPMPAEPPEPGEPPEPIFSMPPLARVDDLYSVPRPLDPSRAAIALGDSGEYEVGPGAIASLYQHALFDGSGGVVRGTEVRRLERRFFALLRLLVKKGLVDQAELVNTLEAEDEHSGSGF